MPAFCSQHIVSQLCHIIMYPVVNLAGVDLNLLVALEALLDHCNVTHAANAVGLSQPAMSRALSRLRGMFNDELLVRASTGYVRTVRGEQISERLPSMLDAVRELIACRDLASDEWRSEFRMAMTDHQALVLLPHVSSRLNGELMNTELVVEPLTANPWKRIENGEIELVIGQVEDVPNGFFQRILYRDEYVSLVRREHPALGEVLTQEHFRELEHAVVACRQDAEASMLTGTVADVPSGNRRVLSPNILGTAMAVAESDAVLTVPRHAAIKLAALLPLELICFPQEVAPYEVKLLWHERSHKSPEHAQIRAAIAAAARHLVGSADADFQNE